MMLNINNENYVRKNKVYGLILIIICLGIITTIVVFYGNQYLTLTLTISILLLVILHRIFSLKYFKIEISNDLLSIYSCKLFERNNLKIDYRISMSLVKYISVGHRKNNILIVSSVPGKKRIKAEMFEFNGISEKDIDTLRQLTPQNSTKLQNQ